MNWAQLVDSLIVGAGAATFFCSAVLLCELGSTQRVIAAEQSATLWGTLWNLLQDLGIDAGQTIRTRSCEL